MQTRVYREQHGRIRQQATALEALDRANASALEIRLALAGFGGTVKSHLLSEDDGLYPRLLAHRDTAVREKAAAFQQSMGSLTAAFSAFYESWKKAGALEANRAGFFSELGSVLHALRARMDLEDRELYALADEQLVGQA